MTRRAGLGHRLEAGGLGRASSIRMLSLRVALHVVILGLLLATVGLSAKNAIMRPLGDQRGWSTEAKAFVKGSATAPGPAAEIQITRGFLPFWSP